MNGMSFPIGVILFVVLLLCQSVCCDERNVIVMVGESAVLPCSVPDDPDASSVDLDGLSVVWRVKLRGFHSSDWTELGNTERGNEKTISEDDRILENLTLLIGQAELNDSGLYACSLVNGSQANSSSSSFLSIHAQMQLNVYERQFFVVEKPFVNVSGPTMIYVKWLPIADERVVSYAILTKNRTGAMSSESVADGVTQHWSTDLLPFTEYQFTVVATDTSGHQSHGVASDWVRTAEAVPSGRITIVKSKSFTESLEIFFELPSSSEWNGNLTGCVVVYSVTGSDTNLTREFADVWTDSVKQTLTVSRLMPDTSYDVRIAVFNKAGTGPFSQPISMKTEEGVPSKPEILDILSRSDMMLGVHWKEPDDINGRLLGYTLFWSSESSRDYRQINSPMTTFNITGLSPYTEYEIQVSAFTKIGSGPKSNVCKTLTDTTAPGVPAFVNVTVNQSDSVIVRWGRPQNFTKQVDAYHLRYAIHGENFFYEMKVEQKDETQDFFEASIPNLVPNKVYEFRVAAVTFSLFSDHSYVGDFSQPQTIALTDGTLTDEPADEGKMSLLTLGIICGVFCCLLLLSGLTIFIISRHFIRTRYQFIADQDGGKQPTAALLLSDVYDPKSCFKESIPVDNFKDHVASLHADGDYLLSQEYEEINQMTPSNSSTSQSCKEENKQKNRYLNILAYDHSRVLLSQLPGKPKQSDYINANFVNGYKQAKAFIATQGPLPSTFGDFWQMVWEQESSVIVMITNLTEKGRRKCDQYWPNEGEHQYDGIAVRLTDAQVKAHYTVRTFVIKHLRHKKRSGNERTVIQYHYTDWPDHGVPTFTLPSLTFVRKSSLSSVTSGKGGPVIVHCSAGVGRTGTYIVIDSMIKQIKDVQSVNIFGFLCHIRNHRNYLVQTEDQYSFIHDAILEYIESRDTEVTSANVSQYIKDLQMRVNNGESQLEIQHKLATSFVPKPYQLASALAPVNEGKNRSNEFIPVELSRVYLPAKAGVDGSDYINATFLQGYSRNEEYIVTQHPLSDGFGDFWQMVWDQNSITIVLLSASDDLDFKQFWPNEMTDCGSFQVSFRREEKIAGGSITNRDFILQSTQDDYECTLRMIEHPTWPEGCSSMTSVCEFVQMAKCWNDQNDETSGGPVIVIDKFGGTKAATFCAIAMLSDQLLNEGCLDVYAVAKLYHMKRPGVFHSVDDYLFLYRAVEGIHGQMNNHCESDAKNSDPTHCNSCNAHLQNTVPQSLSHNSVHSDHSVANSLPV